MYESVGTIRCEVGRQRPRVYFVPDCEHCVKHGKHQFAVFLGKKNDVIVRRLRDGATRLRRHPKGSLHKVVVAAATRQQKVKVKVKGASTGALSLRKVLVPSK